MKKIQLNETFSGEVSLITDSSFCESADFSSLIDGTNIIGLVEETKDGIPDNSGKTSWHVPMSRTV